MTIPKIIHQLAPIDKNKWHPLWEPCQNSWKTAFLNFEYKLWDDDSIDIFIQEEYPEYCNMYDELPTHIMKLDFVRFAILHKFGGIYADMDMFCYMNFYHEFGKPTCYVVENPYGNDPIENSLLASIPNHKFWIQCMELSLSRHNDIKKNKTDYFNDISKISTDTENGTLIRPFLVFHITGTNLISTVYRKNKYEIGVFPGHLYNNNYISYHPKFRTKHIHTGLWGKENIEIKEKRPELYNKLNDISIEEFDFYIDYSNGNFLRTNILDVDKNSYETELNTNSVIKYT